MKIESLFDIQDTENYVCQVWSYALGHGELYIQVVKNNGYQNPENHFYIFFSGTQYFDGPMYWKGLRIRPGTREEYFRMWQVIFNDGAQIPPTEDDEFWESVEQLGRHHQLHIFETDTVNIRVYGSLGAIFTYDEVMPSRE